jgi:hypothetical protein
VLGDAAISFIVKIEGPLNRNSLGVRLSTYVIPILILIIILIIILILILIIIITTTTTTTTTTRTKENFS